MDLETSEVSRSRSFDYGESVEPALQLEWETYSATGVTCETMLNSLYPNSLPHNEVTLKTLRSRLEETLSTTPEVAQYGPIADICNGILHEYEASNHSTEAQPARWFIPLGNTVLDGDYAQRKPDIVVVIRNLWEEHVRTQLKKVPLSQRKESEEWKKRFPEWGAVDDRIRHALNNPESLKADDLRDPQLLRALAVHPPWECIVAIMEFKVSNSPESTIPISASLSSASTNISEKADATPVKLCEKILGPSSMAEHGVTPSASNNSQENNARKPFIPPLAPRKTLRPEIQLLSYFCEVMSAARYRYWTSGAIINGLDFSLVTCDREAAIMSAPTNLGTEEGTTIFSKWILAIGSGPLIQSGFANLFGETASKLDGVDFSIPDDAKRASEDTIRLKFGKQHYQQYGAFGRGTTIYRVDITMGDKNIHGVCKISWPAASRDSEYDLIQQGRVVDPDHLPEVICSWDIKESNLPSRMLRQYCPQAAVEHEPRILRMVVFPFYSPIHDLRGDEFFAALWDVMLCNVKLYEANSVHHRDPSVNNMMYRRDKDGRVIGILSDFDLAVSIARKGKPSSAHRSGTAPFMSLDLLQPNACEQELTHDFESALYIMIWVAVGYKGWRPPNGDPLSNWRRGTWSQIYTAKSVFVDSATQDVIDLITPDYEVVRKRILALFMTIRQQKRSKEDETEFKKVGIDKPAMPPMTALEFFELIGPPPPGHEAYSQITT